MGLFFLSQKQHVLIVGVSNMIPPTQHILFSSQPYHCPTLGKGIPLFNLSSWANPKLMMLSILYTTSVFVSYQKISKAKILRIHIQVFSGIFLLVNTNPLLVHHTTIMMYTLVRTFGTWFNQLCALGGYTHQLKPNPTKTSIMSTEDESLWYLPDHYLTIARLVWLTSLRT